MEKILKKINEELEKDKEKYFQSQNNYNHDKGVYFRGKIVAYEKVLKFLEKKD